MNAAIPSAAAADADVTETVYLLPADAKCLQVSELTARLRERIGPVEDGQTVITRPGFRLTPRLVSRPLAALVDEFRQPSLITDAIYRFSRAHGQDPVAVLEQAFDALATLVTGRILVPSDSAAAAVSAPSLGAGQAFGAYEIEILVRSLDDTEIYKARDPEGRAIALKIARDDRSDLAGTLRHEAAILALLEGCDTPRLYGSGSVDGRPFIAMEWCEGTTISAAAQQARASRDRGKLHRLVGRMFEAYARLHARGILHGDIHTANCLVRDDGRVVIVDFGAAMRIGDSGNVVRGGIPHFHDPEMARALLGQSMPPPASSASEQYGLCVLAYLLLSGVHPVQSSAVQDDLLRRIVRRPPLPFAARGIASWPEAEAVIGRGLAKRPAKRFPDVASLASAWSRVSSHAAPARSTHAPRDRQLRTILDRIRGLAPSNRSPLEQAWLALRAAHVFEEPELLAAAEILIGRAGGGWAAQGIAARIARAQSDAGAEQRALGAFSAAVAGLDDASEAGLAALAAAEILEGIETRRVNADPLRPWLSERMNQCSAPLAPADDAMQLRVALAAGRTGVLPFPGDLCRRLDAIAARGHGDVWLWADAHFAFGHARFLRRALSAGRPLDPAARGFALLRLHQLTGRTAWIEAAREALSAALAGSRRDMLATSLSIELEAPEGALPAAFLLPRFTGSRADALPGRLS
jgi:predicted Ser/Thr protein kinase